jgi:hypothetical protein
MPSHASGFGAERAEQRPRAGALPFSGKNNEAQLSLVTSLLKFLAAAALV